MNFAWLKSVPIDTIIDVGANTGQFSTIARQLWPKAFIYAFEPLPADYMILSNKFKDDKNFISFNYAVADFDRKTDFYISSFTQSSSMLEMGKIHKEAFPFSAENNKIIVDCVQIDTMVTRGTIELERKLDDGKIESKNILLKIDTQGTEDRVLRGAYNMLPFVNVCFIETSFVHLYDDQPLFSHIVLQMEAYRFRYFGNTFGVLYHPQTGIPLEEDSIFINEKIISNLT